MRKSVISLVGGVFLSLLTFTFTACGGVDNPLEELVNSNPEAAEEVFNFLDILEVDSRLVVKFKLNENNTETSCTVTIKNKGNNIYEIESCEGLDPKLFEFALNEDKTKLILTCYEEGDEEAGPARFQFFFNPQEKSFYIVNGLNEDITFDGKVTVNKIEGTLTDECPDKATIKLWYKEVDAECRAGTRTEADGPDGYEDIERFLIVRYKKDDTWQDVVNRYKDSFISGVESDNEGKVFVHDDAPDYLHDPYWSGFSGIFNILYDYDEGHAVLQTQKVGVKDDQVVFGDAYGELFTSNYVYSALGTGTNSNIE